MRLGEVQKAARPQEIGDDLGPSVDVGQPANRAPADEYDIEAGRLRDRRRRVVKIGEDEINPGGQTQPPANRRAAAIASVEKSKPTALAPRCANFRVSKPKWHCRCRTRLPATGPSSASSIG